MTLTLAPQIYMACIEGDIVFLDARTDRYLCIGAEDAPMQDGLLAELREEGLLANPDASRAWAPPRVAPAETHFTLDDRPIPRLRASIVILLVAAALRTGWYRHRRLDRWFVARRRRGSRKPRIFLESALHSFHRLHPWVPRTGSCLPNTIFLTEFLALVGYEVQVVFGVRVHPFEAHCWAQHDGRVLNDSVEHVRWFTPIAAI